MVASMKARLASLPDECVLVFDWNDNASPKNHERMRCAGVGSTNSDTCLKNKHKTLQLSRVFNTFNMSAVVTIGTQGPGHRGVRT